MAGLEKEIKMIRTLLPQIQAGTILEYMRNIPDEMQYLRIHLTLKHFYDSEEKQNLNKLEEENTQYAQLIHDLFPMYGLQKIMKKLQKYGSLSERCKLIIRNILKSSKNELLLGESIINNQSSKRKFDECEEASSSKTNELDTSTFYVSNCEDMKSEDNSRESNSLGENQTAFTESLETIICPVNVNNSNEDTDSEIVEDIPAVQNSLLQNLNEDVNSQQSVKSSLSPQQVLESDNNNAHVSIEDVSSSIPELFNLDYPDLFKDTRFEDCPSVGSGTNQSCNSISEAPVVGEVISSDTCISDQLSQLLSNKLFPFAEAVAEKPPKQVSSTYEPPKKKLKNNPVIQTNATERFDLIGFLCEFTGKPGRVVADYCLRYGIDVYKKPSNKKMSNLMNIFLQDLTSDDDSNSLPFIDLDSLNTTEPIDLSRSSDYDDDSFASLAGVIDVRDKSELPDEGDNDVRAAAPVDAQNSNQGAAPAKKENNNQVVYRVMEIFSDADPNYIRNLYEETPKNNAGDNVIIDVMIEKILEAGDYPKRPQRPPSPEDEMDIESQIAFVSELLPDADPSFLRMKVTELTSDQLKTFVSEALENNNYPTKKEYLRKQQLSAQMRQYTSEFSVENFVKHVPDPVTTFDDPKRKVQIDLDDHYYVQQYFRNKFDRIPVRTILHVLGSTAMQPYRSFRVLRNVSPSLKSRRMKGNLESAVCKNIPLLQEIAFIEHEEEVLEYLNKLKMQKEEERIRAKNNGLVLTCNCCFDDEVMPGDSHTCNNNCVFCKQCIVKSTEVAFGEGKLDFPCLGDCGANISLQTLQNVLPPNLFSKIAQKKALAEVKAAGIEDLESCPFCDFATIPPGPPEVNKIFTCLNPECLKESCRLCKEPSHVPLRCDEVEKDEDVKKRVYIENKMTEALLRKCWKCGVSFYKEEGCNKMTCSCGATMCYICGKPVTDYKHFNGIGGDRYDLCPLYSDTLAINQQNVLKGAQAAKEEIGVDSKELKFDPTSDVEEHYNTRAKKLPREPHLEQLRRLNQRPAVVVHEVQNAGQLQRAVRAMADLAGQFPVEPNLQIVGPHVHGPVVANRNIIGRNRGIQALLPNRNIHHHHHHHYLVNRTVRGGHHHHHHHRHLDCNCGGNHGQ